jgi:hypothetical protein
MEKIVVDTQHVHADASMTEAQVLELATKQAKTVVRNGQILIDVKKIADRCSCNMMPEGTAWMVILYFLAA